jgi:hypothetical protein
LRSATCLGFVADGLRNRTRRVRFSDFLCVACNLCAKCGTRVVFLCSKQQAVPRCAEAMCTTLLMTGRNQGKLKHTLNALTVACPPGGTEQVLTPRS